MNKDLICNGLRNLDTSHRSTGDGGYLLVDSIRHFAQSLDSESKNLLWDVLYQLVEQQDMHLWGVSLEVLIQENPNQVTSRLSRLIDLSARTDEWKDQIVLAVLRLSHQPSASKCISHIKLALRKERTTVLPLLAALCRVDIEACLELSSKYFSKVLVSDYAAEKHQNFIPAFVRNFLDVDDQLLWRLIERTKMINTSSGLRLAKMIKICLLRPFFLKEVGQKRVDDLMALLTKYERR